MAMIDSHFNYEELNLLRQEGGTKELYFDEVIPRHLKLKEQSKIKNFDIVNLIND